MEEQKILIGWGHRDITPELPVMLRGQFHVRVAHEVLDPITVTALAIESQDQSSQLVMVSLDIVCVSDIIRDEARREISEKIDGLNPDNVFFNATHTHASAVVTVSEEKPSITWPDVEGYDREKASRFIVARMVEAVQEAWAGRKLGAISFGVGAAVVGSNRRVSYSDGTVKMLGDTSVREFANIEGDCDSNVNLLFTYDPSHELTGMIVNIPVPSQVNAMISKVSADFWHETRCEIKKRYGDNIYILPQCSAAGDQCPHPLVNPAAPRRMLELKYQTDIETAWRKEIANRIVNAIDETFPIVSKDIRDKAILKHENIKLRLPTWNLTEEHLRLAKKEMLASQEKLDQLEENLLDVDYSSTYARVRYYKNIIERFERQSENNDFSTEINITRLAEIAFATNQFELLLDFGQRIKARSRALQTFLVQLTGTGTYLAPQRSCGSGYGASPMDGEIGPEGGNALVEQTVEQINAMFSENFNPFGARF
ncbi:MAG: neutral/alkaline non-lysosomal ceramidase N-terminal domain-containing protein [Phycisphaerae bacterium]|nr:neutral/alkaline non-lysosomal ceramidase N-terminal domain-containing protein [Phycisphaerae bacterium]